MQIWKKIILAIGTMVFLVSISLFLHFYYYIHSPVTEAFLPDVFLIPKGASFKTAVARLKKKGIVTHPLYFEILARLEKKKGNLKAGEYALDKGVTPIKVLEIITGGKSLQFSLTIPEGFSLKEIAARLERMGKGSSGEFLKAATSRKYLDQYGISSDSFEGYLFPDTYHFSRGTGELTIMKKMADNFIKKVRTEEILRGIEESGFTLHETVTLASLIEKETAVIKEKPLISAVFHNRLKKRMLLQCDPTVIYAIKKFDGNIRRKDLKIDSPYNTYRYKGLPPGPIANPGLGSIKAAYNPVKSSALFFVSKKNGSHYFSTTLKEHNRAVRKYQLNKRS